MAKVALALAGLGGSIRAVRTRGGWVEPCGCRHARHLVLVLMAGIVFLVKAMFYL